MNSKLTKLLSDYMLASSALIAGILEQDTAVVVPYPQPANTPAPAPVAVPMPTTPTIPLAPPISFQPPPVQAPAPVAVAPVAPTVQTTSCPIKTAKELLEYVMAAYATLGAAKGPSMQAILSACGVTNINEVTPDKFEYIWSNIEALKVA